MSGTGEIRRWDEYPGAKGEVNLRVTQCESLAIDQVMPPRFERTRAGRRMIWGPVNGVTGIAPVAALPTTAAQWVMWNPDPQQSYAIDELGLYLVSGTAAAGIVLLVAIVQAPANVGSSVAGMVIQNANGASRSGSKAIFKSGVTLTQPTAPLWWVAAKDDSSDTGVLSVACENRSLDGGLIIPPNMGLAMCALSGTGTTPLFAPYGSHTELKVDSE